MKKSFLFGSVMAAVSPLTCVGDYVAYDFDDVVTGKKTIFWGDAVKGKDAYILQYDEATKKYFFDKVEKNKPSAKSAAKNSQSKATSEDK